MTHTRHQDTYNTHTRQNPLLSSGSRLKICWKKLLQYPCNYQVWPPFFWFWGPSWPKRYKSWYSVAGLELLPLLFVFCGIYLLPFAFLNLLRAIFCEVCFGPIVLCHFLCVISLLHFCCAICIGILLLYNFQTFFIWIVTSKSSAVWFCIFVKLQAKSSYCQDLSNSVCVCICHFNLCLNDPAQFAWFTSIIGFPSWVMGIVHHASFV